MNIVTNFGLLFNKTKEVATGSYDRVSKIGKSYIGKKIIGAIYENVLECAGYYLIGPIGDKIGRIIGRKAGKITASALSITTAALAVRKIGIASIPRAVGSLLVSTVPLICSELIATQGAIVGEYLGGNIGYYAAGILGAYAAIKFTGSEEELIIPEDPMGTYPVKTVICLVAMEIVDRKMWLPQDLIIGFLSSQICASMIYNARDLKDFGLSAHQGKLLSGSLPEELRSPDFMKMRMHQFAESYVAQNLSTIPQRQIQDCTLNLVDQYTPAIPFKFLSLAQLRQSIASSLETHLGDPLEKISSKAAHTFLDNAVTHITSEKISELVFISIIRGINDFFNALHETPALTDSIERIQEQLYRLMKDPNNGVLQQTAVEEFEAFKRQMSKEVLPLVSVVSSAARQTEDSVIAHPLEESLAQLRLCENYLRDVAPAKLAEVFMEFMKDAEESFVGFPLSSPSQRVFCLKLFEAYLDIAAKFAVLRLRSSHKNIESGEIRVLFKNLGSFMADYYSPLIGRSVARSMNAEICRQLDNSDF